MAVLEPSPLQLRLRAALFRPNVLRWMLGSSMHSELLEYCREVGGGGYATAVKALESSHALDHDGESDSNGDNDAEEDELPLEARIGELFSACGEFELARRNLQNSADGAHIPFATRGRILLLLANNEVRKWDSRRDWTSEVRARSET
eukprot:SAG11_NODE_10963_length_793_cov_0.759366_2_plen_148_part_00